MKMQRVLNQNPLVKLLVKDPSSTQRSQSDPTNNQLTEEARNAVVTWLDLVKSRLSFCYNPKTQKQRVCQCLSDSNTHLVAKFMVDYCFSSSESREVLELNMMSEAAKRYKEQKAATKEGSATRYRLVLSDKSTHSLCPTSFHNLFHPSETRGSSTLKDCFKALEISQKKSHEATPVVHDDSEIPVIQDQSSVHAPVAKGEEPKLKHRGFDLESPPASAVIDEAKPSSGSECVFCETHEQKKSHLDSNPVKTLIIKTDNMLPSSTPRLLPHSAQKSCRLEDACHSIRSWLESLKETVPHCYNPGTKKQKKKCRCLSSCESEGVAAFAASYALSRQDYRDRVECQIKEKADSIKKQGMQEVAGDGKKKVNRPYKLDLDGDRQASLCLTGFQNLLCLHRDFPPKEDRADDSSLAKDMEKEGEQHAPLSANDENPKSDERPGVKNATKSNDLCVVHDTARSDSKGEDGNCLLISFLEKKATMCGKTKIKNGKAVYALPLEMYTADLYEEFCFEQGYDLSSFPFVDRCGRVTDQYPERRDDAWVRSGRQPGPVSDYTSFLLVWMKECSHVVAESAPLKEATKPTERKRKNFLQDALLQSSLHPIHHDVNQLDVCVDEWAEEQRLQLQRMKKIKKTHKIPSIGGPRDRKHQSDEDMSLASLCSESSRM